MYASKKLPIQRKFGEMFDLALMIKMRCASRTQKPVSASLTGKLSEILVYLNMELDP
jgi:hypothetical protein